MAAEALQAADALAPSKSRLRQRSSKWMRTRSLVRYGSTPATCARSIWPLRRVPSASILARCGTPSERLAAAGGPLASTQNPPGEPECFFRCGQSDEEAVGCGLTPEFKVICHRPCDNNKCG